MWMKRKIPATPTVTEAQQPKTRYQEQERHHHHEHASNTTNTMNTGNMNRDTFNSNTCEGFTRNKGEQDNPLNLLTGTSGDDPQLG